MPQFPIIFRQFLRPLRMLEYQIRQPYEFFRPTFNLSRLSREVIEYPEMHNEESMIEDKEKFQVKLNVQDFKPEDIVIKSLGDNTLQIEAKYEVKQNNDQDFSLKQMVRRFVLPPGHDIKNSYSTLSSDGILTITTPKNIQELEEKTIPITHENAEEPKRE